MEQIRINGNVLDGEFESYVVAKCPFCYSENVLGGFEYASVICYHVTATDGLHFIFSK